MRRVTCVYFPDWPLQRLRQERSELSGKPLALFVPRPGKGSHIALCCELAARAGIRRGMPVVEALAVQPTLQVSELQPERDIAALKQLAEWMERFSPIVGLEEGPHPHCLLIDITGCGACFGGEGKLVEQARCALRKQGWSVRVAVAETIGAAWAAAHYDGGELNDLPIAALRLPADAARALRALGIDAVHQLMVLPRPSLPARFGVEIVRRLDQASGHVPELIHPQRPAPEACAAYPFEYATDRLEALSIAAERLILQIHAMLQSPNSGVRRMECWLYHETAAPHRIDTALFRPSRSPEHLQRLLMAQLESVRLAEPVAGLSLRVTETEMLSDVQTDFLENENRRSEEQALADLIDRLSIRLGSDAVTVPELVPDPQPEYSWRFVPLVSTAKSRTTSTIAARKRRSRKTPTPVRFPEGAKLPIRPVCVWPKPVQVKVMSVVPEGPPIRLSWAGRDYAILRSWGPERIKTGWWRDGGIGRDYYAVATDSGARFWMFRRLKDDRWFLHGCYE